MHGCSAASTRLTVANRSQSSPQRRLNNRSGSYTEVQTLSPSVPPHREAPSPGMTRGMAYQDPYAALYSVDLTERCATLLGRSEEHTSELQYLMRISYTVF